MKMYMEIRFLNNSKPSR